MPANTEEIAAAKMTELSNSLDRIVDCLKILSGQEKGSSALAEMELKEEMAYPYLFYDIEHILIKETEKWRAFLDLAQKYQLTLST